MLAYLKWWSNVSHFTDQYSFNTTGYLIFKRDYEHTMARSKSQKSSKAAGNAPQIANTTEWANMRLTSDDAPYITEEAKDLPSLVIRLCPIFLTGADFSIRFNPLRQNYSAFIISPENSDGTARVGISAFGPDIATTLSAVLYKFELYQQSPEKFAAGVQSLGFG